MLLSRAEVVGRRGIVHAVFSEYIAREVLMMNRIREILRLQAERTAPAIGGMLLALSGRAVNEIAGIELHARQIRIHIHLSARLPAEGCRRMNQLPIITPSVNHEIVVKAAHQMKLLFILIDIPSNRFRNRKVKGCAFYTTDLAGRD